jgi:hypothetical protein
LAWRVYALRDAGDNGVHLDARDEVRAGIRLSLRPSAAWNKANIERANAVADAIAGAIEAIIQHVPSCPRRTHAIKELINARIDAHAALRGLRF